MSTRNLTITLLVLLGAFAVLAIWLSLGRPWFSAPLPETTSYRSSNYGYSFSYPRTLTLEETSSRRVAIGSTGEAGFTEQAVVQVVRTETPTANFRTFITGEIRRLCATEIDSAATTCGAIVSEESVRTEGSLLATKYVFSVTAAGATTTTFGPVYAFDVTGTIPSYAHAGILVYPPVSQVLIGTPDETLLKKIADGLTIGG